MRKLNLNDFGHITSARNIVSSRIALAELPTLDDVKTLAKWNNEIYEIYRRDSDFFKADRSGNKEDRSSAMAKLSYLGAELGWSDEQIYVLLQDVDDRWSKYKGRTDRERRLVEFINRARQKHGYIATSDLTFQGLLSAPKESDPVKLPDDSEQLVYGWGEFIDTEYKIDWTLDQLLAQGGFGLITGWPGTGKTTFCIQLGAYLALGNDVFLKWDNKGGKKKVLFLSLEMSAPPLNHFLTTISPSYDDKNTLNRNFLVAPVGSPMPLDSKPGQAFLTHLLDQYKPDVLIIDSLQKISSKELTDETAVKNLLNFLAIVRSKYQTSLLIVHHNRKKANDGQKKLVELSDVYGSTYITAEVDFVLNLHTQEKDMLSVTTLKNRLGMAHDPFQIYRNENLTFTMESVALTNMAKEAKHGFQI